MPTKKETEASPEVTKVEEPTQHPGWKSTEFLASCAATVLLVLLKSQPQVFAYIWGAYSVSRGISKLKMM